jgi:TrmH family RNA methyltransferase
MGLGDLVLVNPQRYPHPQARAQAAGAGAMFEHVRVVETLEQAVADCAWAVATSSRPRHLGDEPLTPPAFAQRALELAHGEEPARVALVFGCERTGLTNAELDRCHARTLIPANPEYCSLNLAQAVQLFAWELRKAALPDVPTVAAKRVRPQYAPPSAEEMEHYFEHLQRVLLETGFLDPANPRVLMRRLRQFYGRSMPDRNELNMLRGILSSFQRPKVRKRAPE